MTKLSQYDSIILAENFDTTITKGEKICLYYKNKPLLEFGGDIKFFDTTFSFRNDPNGSYQDFFNEGITDYLSLDDFYSTKLSTGKIDGALYFSADNKKRIFKLKATFVIEGDLVDTSGMEIMKCLQDKYFPCLPTDFKGEQKFELTHENFVEQFRLYLSPDNTDAEYGLKPQWYLDYLVRPMNKNGL